MAEKNGGWLMYGGYGYYLYGLGSGDGSYMLVIIALVAALIIGLIAQARVKAAFKKYSEVRSLSGRPACDVARELLWRHGSAVQVTEVGGQLTDHYNPKSAVVGLSNEVYSSDSLAALAIAAHEVGHVLQYQEEYAPIRIRNAILPVASLSSSAAPFIVIIGLLMNSYTVAILGVTLFAMVLIFQLVTLPVEFNASQRAMALLTEGGYIANEQERAASKVLRAAAMTYVAAALATAVSLLRLLMIAKRTRR